MINKNPFAVNRAEYMKNLWRYYVPFKDSPENVNKSIIVVGGRGTGKSMFFLCNSWREKYCELEAINNAPLHALLLQKQIGIYYKVDSTFVGAMTESDPNRIQWNGCFNTYLSISLLVELLPLIQKLYENSVIDIKDINDIVSVYFRTVHNISSKKGSLEDIKADCFSVLQEIEDEINFVSEEDTKFRKTQPGTIFKSIIDILHGINPLSEVVFKVYIDEYESFSEWQQKIINTLIKQSDNVLIYNIGMRHNGMKTQETLGENEILQATHDYRFFNFDDLLIEKDYENILKNICKKRFELFFAQNGLTNAPSTDIEFYLSTYSTVEEVARFDKRNFKFKKELEKIIREQCQDESKKENLVKTLCTDAPALNARLHMALLLRAQHYKPSLEQLYNGYVNYEKGNTNVNDAKKYQEWLHNAKNGLIFLLLKDLGIMKWYYGFDAFAALSSGVVRCFLELCEQTFNIAMMEGFSWEAPRPISCEIQTRAARYVSQNKVNEISSYPICGKKLRIFVQCFGEICRDLHRNDLNTLGEPEVNHFTTESLQLSKSVENDLNDAVTWMVLQKLPQTKSKETFRTDILDYHLNKIYTPYFEISYNKKRKIKLNIQELEKMFSGDISIANKASKAFLDTYWGRKKHISKESEKSIEQLNLFTEE